MVVTVFISDVCSRRKRFLTYVWHGLLHTCKGDTPAPRLHDPGVLSAPIILIICDRSAMCYARHLFDFNTINFPVVNKLVRTCVSFDSEEM